MPLAIWFGRADGQYTKRQVHELRKALHIKIPEVEPQRTQMGLPREKGVTQQAIAKTMGVSLSTVNRAHMAYDRGGIKARSSRSRAAAASAGT